MNTLNLFKNIKNISYVTAFACLPLSSACGTEPQEIIEAYAKDAYLCWASGNVLAYKNIEGKTVVLKSGRDFAFKKPIEKDVRVVSLEEVVKHITGSNDKSINFPKTMKDFGDCCKTDNKDWYEYIKSKHPYTIENLRRYNTYKAAGVDHIELVRWNWETITINIDRNYQRSSLQKFPVFSYKYGKFTMDPCMYIQACYDVDLHHRLGNFRHTEIQVQSLWNKYRECKDENIKKKIASLLPIALTAPENKDNKTDDKIYSLFEACGACEQTKWLQSRKNVFMFKIADGQISDGGVRYKIKKGFMSQEALEKAIEKLPAKDIKQRLLNKDFEKLK